MSTQHYEFPRLFRPITLKNVTLRNRIAVSAHFAGWWVTDGLPNEEFAAYIEERAKGGIGLFVIGATGPTYDAGPDWIQNTSEAIVPRYRMLAEAGRRAWGQGLRPTHSYGRPAPRLRRRSNPSWDAGASRPPRPSAPPLP